MTAISRFLFLSMIGVLSCALAPVTHADDFVVSTPVTVQNGGNVLDGGDSISITSDGSIVTSSGAAVSLTGLGNRVTNSGRLATTGNAADGIASATGGSIIVNDSVIETFGNFAFGIFGATGETITNNGAITTQGNNSDGMVVADTGTAVNNGAISTSGFNSYGIAALFNNMVTNNGTVTTTGNDGYAVFGFDENTVINNGIIRVTGGVTFDIDGIDLGDDNIVINRGLIETFGDGSDGIDTDDDNTIVNTGRVIVHGTSAEAIDVDDDSTITNSGTLISMLGNSIEMSGTGNVLNLLAPSFLAGAIDFGGNQAVVNITTGPPHSVAWNLPSASLVGSAPTVTGTVPFAYDGVTFATVDPTVFASIYDMLGQRSDLLFGLFDRGASRSHYVSDGEALGYAANRRTDAEQVINGSFDQLPEIGPRFWAEGLGAVGRVRANGVFNAHMIAHGGAAFGVDTHLGADGFAGVLAGYVAGFAQGMAPMGIGFEDRSHGGFLGAYGHWAHGDVVVDAAALAGATGHAQRRFVNDNLAPLGISWASSDFGSVWIAPELVVGFDYHLNDAWVAKPAVHLRGAGEWLGGYSEVGTVANLSVPSRFVGYGEVALDLGLSGRFGSASLDMNAGYAYRAMLGGGTTAVNLLGQNVAVPSYPGNQHLVFAGADFEQHLGGTIALNIGAKVVLSPNYTGGQAQIGITGTL